MGDELESTDGAAASGVDVDLKKVSLNDVELPCSPLSAFPMMFCTPTTMNGRCSDQIRVGVNRDGANKCARGLNPSPLDKRSMHPYE